MSTNKPPLRKSPVKPQTAFKKTKGQLLGVLGEQLAEAYLTHQQYQLVAQNWRYGAIGEIDRIMYHPSSQTLVFVEVKTRLHHSGKQSLQTSPLEAVTPTKQKQLLRLAEAYIALHLTPPPTTLNIQQFRFDVIGIEVLEPPLHDNSPKHRLTHLENAFDQS